MISVCGTGLINFIANCAYKSYVSKVHKLWTLDHIEFSHICDTKYFQEYTME